MMVCRQCKGFWWLYLQIKYSRKPTCFQFQMKNTSGRGRFNQVTQDKLVNITREQFLDKTSKEEDIDKRPLKINSDPSYHRCTLLNIFLHPGYLWQFLHQMHRLKKKKVSWEYSPVYTLGVLPDCQHLFNLLLLGCTCI